jgi:hypothetical protein
MSSYAPLPAPVLAAAKKFESLWLTRIGISLLLGVPLFVGLVTENVPTDYIALGAAALVLILNLRRFSINWLGTFLVSGALLILGVILLVLLSVTHIYPVSLKLLPTIAFITLGFNFAGVFIKEYTSDVRKGRWGRDRLFNIYLWVTLVPFFGYGGAYALVGSDGWTIVFTALTGWIYYLGTAQDWADERSSLKS